MSGCWLGSISESQWVGTLTSFTLLQQLSMTTQNENLFKSRWLNLIVDHFTSWVKYYICASMFRYFPDSCRFLFRFHSPWLRVCHALPLGKDGLCSREVERSAQFCLEGRRTTEVTASLSITAGKEDMEIMEHAGLQEGPAGEEGSQNWGR